MNLLLMSSRKLASVTVTHTVIVSRVRLTWMSLVLALLALLSAAMTEWIGGGGALVGLVFAWPVSYVILREIFTVTRTSYHFV
jgi:hypothetical protein